MEKSGDTIYGVAFFVERKGESFQGEKKGHDDDNNNEMDNQSRASKFGSFSKKEISSKAAQELKIFFRKRVTWKKIVNKMFCLLSIENFVFGIA